ncbi:MAG: peptide chain release factor N(5)-glutamine methyltransferase [candidate division Zixibacteria bacterium]|nr:peptide chain release factor N(5)-glutamine methyltransferase [candidate division Zixibacteria bacterium]
MNVAALSPITTLDAIRRATEYLRKAGIEQDRLNAELLAGKVLNLSRINLYLDFDRPFDPKEKETLAGYLKRRVSGEPLQYILGRTEFYGLTFSVDSSVLIPRPETEILVEHVLGFLKERRSVSKALPSGLQLDLFASFSETAGPPVIVDIGVGCGTIALTLAHEVPDACVYAIDLSPEALGSAQHNASALRLEDRVRFFQGGSCGPLATASLHGGCDVIVSNPPYIRTADIETLPVEIRAHEPRLALDGGEDGLDVLREIVAGAPTFLKPGGMLALEIGYDQAESVKKILEDAAVYQNITIVRDYSRRDRVVAAVIAG